MKRAAALLLLTYITCVQCLFTYNWTLKGVPRAGYRVNFGDYSSHNYLSAKGVDILALCTGYPAGNVDGTNYTTFRLPSYIPNSCTDVNLFYGGSDADQTTKTVILYMKTVDAFDSDAWLSLGANVIKSPISKIFYEQTPHELTLVTPKGTLYYDTDMVIDIVTPGTYTLSSTAFPSVQIVPNVIPSAKVTIKAGKVMIYNGVTYHTPRILLNATVIVAAQNVAGGKIKVLDVRPQTNPKYRGQLDLYLTDLQPADYILYFIDYSAAHYNLVGWSSGSTQVKCFALGSGTYAHAGLYTTSPGCVQISDAPADFPKQACDGASGDFIFDCQGKSQFNVTVRNSNDVVMSGTGVYSYHGLTKFFDAGGLPGNVMTVPKEAHVFDRGYIKLKDNVYFNTEGGGNAFYIDRGDDKVYTAQTTMLSPSTNYNSSMKIPKGGMASYRISNNRDRKTCLVVDTKNAALLTLNNVQRYGNSEFFVVDGPTAVYCDYDGVAYIEASATSDTMVSIYAVPVLMSNDWDSKNTTFVVPSGGAVISYTSPAVINLKGKGSISFVKGQDKYVPQPKSGYRLYNEAVGSYLFAREGVVTVENAVDLSFN